MNPQGLLAAAKNIKKPQSITAPVSSYSKTELDSLLNTPSPERPYAGVRATPTDLASFPIGSDEFMSGGGRLMFQDAVKQPPATTITPAAVKKPAPAYPSPVKSLKGGKKLSDIVLPNTETKVAEDSMLATFRDELFSMQRALGKQASLNKEQILAITSSEEAFVKAASEEAARVWNGFTKELRKQGANEDFIAGMVKEAEGLGAAVNPISIKGSINTPPTPATQSNQAAHQVIPHIDNKWTGALGGSMLMGLLANQLGLEGPAAWLLPVLGGLGGHHFFPKLMDSFKDAPGTGVNKLHPEAVKINQQTPLTPSIPKAPSLPKVTPPVDTGLKGGFSSPVGASTPSTITS